MTRDAAHALADVIQGIRPDWHRPGIIAALWRTTDREDHPDPDTITDAAIAAAENPRNRTPAVIPLDGAHWQQTITAPTPPPWRAPASELTPEERTAINARGRQKARDAVTAAKAAKENQ